MDMHVTYTLICSSRTHGYVRHVHMDMYAHMDIGLTPGTSPQSGRTSPTAGARGTVPSVDARMGETQARKEHGE